jgi:hypothetical protein
MVGPAVPFLQVHDTCYPWYRISLVAPKCLANKLYPNERNLPALAKLSSALPDFKLIHRVLPDSSPILIDSARVSSCPLKMRIGAPSRATY